MSRNYLRTGFTGLLLLTLLSLLLSCQGGSKDSAVATEEPKSETMAQPTAPTTPVVQATIKAEDKVSDPTSVPKTVPKAVTTDSPTATAVNSDEAPIMNENGQEANADVEFVRAVQSADGSWTFHVTVRHPDTGWEDYADGWDVVLPDGSALKRGADEPFTRLLLHPHESEQPFTRSQNGLLIPAGISEVTVRAHDLVDGFGGRQVIVNLHLSAGPDFEVERK